MFIKINYLFALLSMVFISSSNASISKSFPLNNVGCIIVNDGYFENEPKILKSNVVKLSIDINDNNLIYKNDEITMKASAAVTMQTGIQDPWISSFKLTVLQNNKDSISIRSYPRSSDNGNMDIYFTISSERRGEVFVSCSARE
ncbi:hypothetical protein I6F65_03335 [Pseudoalteromonas sp. SWXJZ94C]|uniref:hypothetical protein n=1 Tax=Pseudoalteromonas sp. SWXJZ94C TaxID=2792065 RepID=UPI0018CDBD64|nr:hypothetical protein [Pseudoalteromonas sp. SWXJZ94C]MBH0055984.1 hypothetical protein [Pseudoalteromonas sp. SWXJZ94C]